MNGAAMTNSWDATSYIYMQIGLKWRLEVEHSSSVCIVGSIYYLNVASHQLVIAVLFNWQHVNLIQKFYLKQCRYVSLWIVIFKLIEMLIYLIFIRKIDSKVTGGLSVSHTNILNIVQSCGRRREVGIHNANFAPWP